MAVGRALGSPVMPGRGLLVYLDVTEPPCGHRHVLWQYLYVAVDFGPLAVQAGKGTGVGRRLKVPSRQTWRR